MAKKSCPPLSHPVKCWCKENSKAAYLTSYHSNRNALTRINNAISSFIRPFDAGFTL